MVLKTKELTGGAGLGLIETDKFKTNYFSLAFSAPLEKSTAALNALLPMVLTRGTRSLPTMAAINRRLDTLYATTLAPRCIKRGETQFFGLAGYALDNGYAPDGCDIIGGALELMNDIINDPFLADGCFKPEYVESEKSNLCDRIAAAQNNKNRYAVTRCAEEMCRGEAFGISELGNIDTVSSITPETIYAHYLNVISSLRAQMFYVGRYSDGVEKGLLSSVSGHDKNVRFDTSCRIIPKADGVRRVSEDASVRQAKLSLGFRTGITLADKDFWKFTLFNEVFSSSPMSKLFRNVREKLSLAYYCHAIPEAQKGIMIVTAGIDSKNKETAENEILSQLEAVRCGGITDDELCATKASVVNSYRELNDSPEALERWYTARMMAGRSDSPEDAAASIINGTKDDIAEIAGGISLDTVYYMNPTLTEGEDGTDE